MVQFPMDFQTIKTKLKEQRQVGGAGRGGAGLGWAANSPLLTMMLCMDTQIHKQMGVCRRRRTHVPQLFVLQ